MSDLIVVAFDDEYKAEEVRTTLLRLQKDYLIDLEDAVVVVRKADGQVKLNQIHHLAAGGALSGGFWGMLIGLIFLHPFLGLFVGASAGAVAGAFADVGINNDFMKELGETLLPGSSALFVLVRKATPDKVFEELKGVGGKILRTSLSKEDEKALQHALDAVKRQQDAA